MSTNTPTNTNTRDGLLSHGIQEEHLTPCPTFSAEDKQCVDVGMLDGCECTAYVSWRVWGKCWNHPSLKLVWLEFCFFFHHYQSIPSLFSGKTARVLFWWDRTRASASNPAPSVCRWVSKSKFWECMKSLGRIPLVWEWCSNNSESESVGVKEGIHAG